ncbi:uncharacterized protein FTOL_02400 [Fusarium torulosum]|uniref:Reverse transcriptase domain-containing protein n=1 Tax=Fusarium torulosum TaxID=33205 RepID=A0AAE8M1R2_9HYPO|nr:uncharacterized protein FTOL_02400 [Fusarium torulosum]
MEEDKVTGHNWHNNLKIVQVNIRRSADRLRHLMDWLKQQERPPDLVALQDPPLNIRILKTESYCLAFGPNNPERVVDSKPNQDLSNGNKKKSNTSDTTSNNGDNHNKAQEEEHPKNKKKEREKLRKADEKLHQVCYLVHESIPVQDWGVIFHNGDNIGLAATLFLRIANGRTVAIHNVYNRLKLVNIRSLLAKVSSSGRNLLLGDFNLHHPEWGGEKAELVCEDEAKVLQKGLKEAGMECVTPPGVLTYSRRGYLGSFVESEYNSTIDLTYASEGLASFVEDYSIPDMVGYESDHRVIQTTLSLEVDRTVSTYYRWKKVDAERFRDTMIENLAPLGFPALATSAATDIYTNKIFQAFHPVIKKLVPLAPPPGSKRPQPEQSPVTRKALLLEKVSRMKSGNERTKQYRTKYWMLKKRLGKVLLKERIAAFRQLLDREAVGRRKLYFWAKQGAKWNKKKLIPQLRQLKASGQTYRTPEGMVHCVRDAIWPETSDGQSPPRSERPAVDPHRTQHTMAQELTSEEVALVIHKLPTGKAAGPDLIANEAMKMVAKQLVPYLHHLFTACFELGHHPRAFKHASTVMLRKPGKATYEEPKSWRPIALLPCMGKLLEKIFTNRLKELAMKESLLPNLQFGLPGRCTTKALQFMLNNVYDAWHRPQSLVTLMGLDITGAYDRVDRVKLMKILEDAGLRDWMLSYVWSFLSDRSTDMKLPGFTSSKFWVNIGIPQGSPLSPILFLFFSSPILAKAAEYKEENYRVTIQAFAYVDDTYLMASSNNYATNCKALKECHDRIMTWADLVGVSFAPHKYHVMHFRPPYFRGAPCHYVPLIPGLIGKQPERTMVILGVEVDNRLNWKDHIIGEGPDFYELAPHARTICINEIAKAQEETQPEQLWDKYRRERAQVHPHPTTAIEGTWGMHNKEFYGHLSRAQSTLLLQLRTEVIGPKTKPEIATDWAISHFNLAQFESAKEHSRFRPTVEPSLFLPHLPFSQTLHEAIALFMSAGSSAEGETNSNPTVESSPPPSPTLFAQTLQEAVALFKGVDSSG